MRYCRFLSPEGARWGKIEQETIIVMDRAPFEFGRPTGKTLPLAEARLLGPAAPSKIVCVGRNYADHAAELGNEVPEEPMLFLKAPSSIIGPDEPIQLATADRRTDFEGELVIVMGKEASRVPRRKALEYVLGYTCGNDVSDRVLQKKDGQFGRAKSFDTYGPMGPWIETDLDPSNLTVETRLNGEIKQSGSTKQLIFDVPYLIEFISNVMTLHPGDMIMTGTPAGVSPMAPGDVVEIHIEGIGTLKNPVRLRS